MDEELGGPLFHHFMDVSALDNNSSLLSELNVSENSGLRGEIESASDANDVLKNGILIETSKGVELLSLTDALTSGVGGLNLSVEDFQNVAAQLLHSQTAVVGKNISSPSSGSADEERHVLVSADSLKTLQCLNRINTQLESISEAAEHVEDVSKVELSQPSTVKNGAAASLRDKILFKKKTPVITSSDSSSLTVSESTGTNSDSSVQSVPIQQVKRKGGWPKGRKRKPELANRPPKAPCTGYVYYLNENRRRTEFRNTPFPEITKILGNEWSSLSLETKKEYLEKAEIDKKRYREELKLYRNSETYRSYLKRRRIKSYKNNGTEESDVTDEIDDEDNEELYCRDCDQWFTTLHNKREHLSGKQHFQTISQKASNSISLDESRLDGTSLSNPRLVAAPVLPSVPEAMAHFLSHVTERERELKILQERQKSLMTKNKQILRGLQEIKQSQVKLQRHSAHLKAEQLSIERAISELYQVPALLTVHLGTS